MSSKKGEKKTFPLSVVAIITSGRQLFPNSPVTAGDVADVNKHLFPKSGVCMGILVGEISQKKSKPEILRQHPVLNRKDLAYLEPQEIYDLFGSDRVVLESTGE